MNVFFRLVLSLMAVFAGLHLAAQSPVVHDPVMIRENSTWYLFSTGWGIDVWSSGDMKSWTREKPVFSKAPDWAVAAIPGFKGHIWAPEIVFRNGTYYLFYSVSAFGKNTSCIGVATAKALDPADPGFGWTDHGKLIESVPGKTNWNAIDPAVAFDRDGTPYLFFGSFWDGLKRVKLTADLLHTAENPDAIPTVASRKTIPGSPNPPSIDDNPVDAGGNAIEAPFVFRRGDYYYLFASIDYCCKGLRSSYKMIVGRSKELTGIFTDRHGADLSCGGGTVVLGGNAGWHGVGHNAVVSCDGKDYLVFHGYDASDNGQPKLLIREIVWDHEQWPVVRL